MAKGGVLLHPGLETSAGALLPQIIDRLPNQLQKKSFAQSAPSTVRWSGQSKMLMFEQKMNPEVL